MGLLIVGLILVVLQLSLAIYFVFTVVAIFRGSAPIPSRHSTVKRMMAVAAVKPGDRLVDLGSGDGRILFHAAARGAECVGFEINPFLCWYTRLRAFVTRTSGVQVLQSDLWKADLSQADVLTIYMVPQYMPRLKAKVQAEMKPGSRIVAAVYPFPDWEPQQRVENVFLYML